VTDRLTQGPPPTWRESATYRLRDLVGYGMAKTLMDAADYTPLGAVFASNEAGAKLRDGRKGAAALGLGGALLAGLPLPAAKVSGKVARAAKKALAMDEASRMARAAEQGFDTSRPMYRGMSRAYDSGKTGNYQMFTSSPLDASEYAGGFEGANVLPAFTRGGKGATIDAGGANWNAIPRYAIPDDIKAQLHPSVGAQVRTDEFIHAARDAGYDSATIQNVFDNISGTIRKAPRPAKNRDSELDALFAELDGMDLGVGADVPMIADQAVNYDPVTVQAIFDPANIRSKFAAFDPAKRKSANLLAGIGGAGIAVPLTIGQMSQQRQGGGI